MGLVCSGPWGQIYCRALGLTLRICLVGVILGRMKKNQEENMGENSWEGYLVRRGGRRENWWGSGVFHPGSPKINLPKSRRKQRRKFVLFVHTSKRLFGPSIHSQSKSNAWLFNIILFLFLFSPFVLTTTNLPELIWIKKNYQNQYIYIFFSL